MTVELATPASPKGRGAAPSSTVVQDAPHDQAGAAPLGRTGDRVKGAAHFAVTAEQIGQTDERQDAAGVLDHLAARPSRGRLSGSSLA